MTGRLFSESLQGTHDTLNDQEDQVQLSRKPSIGEVETYSHTPPEPFSQDPDDFFCWSPQCATPQTRAFPPTPSHFQTQMRPEPHEWSSSPQPYSAVSRNPTMREISSIYSHANSPSSSTHSRHANSMNSTRDIYRHTTMKKISSASTAPSAPKVSQLFRRNSLHGFQRGQKPSRPSSRPSMPPAAFWRYAAERRAGEASPVSLQCWQLESDGRKREPSMCRYPIITSRPVSAATRQKRVHHSNYRAVRRRSYESIRKGISDLDVYSHDALCPDLGDGWDWEGTRLEMEVQNKGISRRSGGNRLVKKRQPWDAEPRRKSRNRPSTATQ